VEGALDGRIDGNIVGMRRVGRIVGSEVGMFDNSIAI